jgi:hypothetical protein
VLALRPRDDHRRPRRGHAIGEPSSSSSPSAFLPRDGRTAGGRAAINCVPNPNHRHRTAWLSPEHSCLARLPARAHPPAVRLAFRTRSASARRWQRPARDMAWHGPDGRAPRARRAPGGTGTGAAPCHECRGAPRCCEVEQQQRCCLLFKVAPAPGRLSPCQPRCI